jgi:hypothetical protein
MTRWCVTASSVVLVIAGCSRAPEATTAVAPPTPYDESVYCSASPEELAEIRQRNRDRPPFTSADLHKLMKEPEHATYLRLWRDQRSYYALLALVEGVVQPEAGRIRKQDVRELLGDAFPYNNNARTLHYAGHRPLPYGTHAVIVFDERDTVTDVDWVSE